MFCEYCMLWKDGTIHGKDLGVNKTSRLKEKPNSDKLQAFLMRNKADDYAGIMIGTYEGFHYININYCPMCGRKI